MKKIAVSCFAVATCFCACATDSDIHNAGAATRKAWSGESFPKDHKWPINPQPLYWE